MDQEQISEIPATSPLTDIEDIVAARPDFTPAEWEIVGKATAWLKATLRPDVRKDLDVEYAKSYAAEIDLIRSESQKQIKADMEEWKLSQKPLDKEEMGVLLSQEYITFPVKVMMREDNKPVFKDFTLCELPQTLEKKFADTAERKLLKLIEAANAMDWNMDLSTAQQLQMILSNLPEALDVASELAAICLNPWGEHPEITSKWVQDNLSTYRIANILIAQSEVNKYRDFFSNGFRLFRSLKTR